MRDPGLASRRVATLEARVDHVRNGAASTRLLLSEAVGVDVEALPRRLLLRQDAAKAGASPLSLARPGDRLLVTGRLS